MSRIGRKPVSVPEGVTVTQSGESLTVKGPLGELTLKLPIGVSIEQEGAEVNVQPPKLTRRNRGYQGLTRALLANMVHGVTKGYEKSLEINGVGYKADLKGDELVLNLGYSHLCKLKIPSTIKCEVNKQQTGIKISGTDKQLVGEIAARIRAFKVPEPYKAKGVKYADETLRRKVGKAGAK